MTDIRASDDFAHRDDRDRSELEAHRSDDESGVGKLAELLADTRTVMLTTVGPDGTLLSRPMAVQDTEFAGSLWLFATKDSPKVAQIAANPHVSVVSMSKDAWISIDGHAEVVDDRQRIHDYWNPFVAGWFTGGPYDPNVVLIEVVGESAEWWEQNGNQLTAVLKTLRSAVTHKPATDVGENEKVDL